VANGVVASNPEMTSQGITSSRSKYFNPKGAPGLWLGALTVVAATIRWMVARNEGLWRDEGLFLAIVRLPRWSDTIEFLRFHESHPPLFYALMRIWLTVAGDSDTTAVRLVLLIGTLLVPAIYLVGKRLYSQRVGIIAAVLATISPVLIDHASMVRPYPLLQLLVLVSTCALALALKTGRSQWWAVFAVSTLSMIYTHNWTWLIAAGDAVGFGFFVFVTAENRKRQIANGILAALVIALAFAPWAPSLKYQSGHAGYSPVDVDIWHVLFILPFTLEATILPGLGNPRQKLAIASAATLFLSLLALFWAYRRVRKLDRKRDPQANGTWHPVSRTMTFLTLVISTTVLGLALALSSHTNLLQPRCFSMLTPVWLIGLSAAADRQWRATARPSLTAALGCAAALIFGLYVGGINRLLTTSKSNAREVARAVERKARPTDLLILLPEWLASSFNHYFQPPNQQVDYPHNGREEAVDFAGLMPRLSDPDALNRTLKRVYDARAAGRRVWLISDWPNFMPLDSLNAIGRRSDVAATFIVPLRVAQLRGALLSLYGEPDTTLSTDHLTDRYEHFIAYLFSPPDPTRVLSAPPSR
jgi:4-amino-4-deoxy-L-arabinose transferase-like glycosyltransferase